MHALSLAASIGRISVFFVLGNFSGNPAIIKKWLLNQTISIVP
jgi:hypothetical protein